MVVMAKARRSQMIDMTGKVFTRWRVIHEDHKPGYWICECSCGTVRSVNGSNLRQGSSRSCGCLPSKRSHVFKDLSGKKFGRLRVVCRDWSTNNRNPVFKCICQCGVEKIVEGHNLVSGGTVSCGCWRAEKASERRGENSPVWRGGVYKDKHGYVHIRKPDHPNARSNGMVLQHKLVMSQFLGRPLTKEETVHHINGIKDDNRIENLELWSSSHPSGQRVKDKVQWALGLINRYGYGTPSAKFLRGRKWSLINESP